MSSVELGEPQTDFARWNRLWQMVVSAPGLAILAGILHAATFPPVGLAWVEWFALVPLLALIEKPGRPAKLYLSAWLGGLVFWVFSLQWLWELHPDAWLGWLALAVYMSLYWPLFLGFARRLVALRVPMVLSAPVAWLACDYLQSFLLSGLPWYYPAQSQYQFLPIIQVSDLLGVWLVSALIVMSNAALLTLIQVIIRSIPPAAVPATPRTLIWPGLTAALLSLSLIYGYYRINQAQFTPGPDVILLQSNLRQALKMGMSAEDIVRIYVKLIESGLEKSRTRSSDAGSLVIWPETSYPWGYVWVDENLTPDQAAESGRKIFPAWSLAEVLNLRTETARDLNELSRAIGRPMIVGSVLYELLPDRGQKSNAAIWIDGKSDRPQLYRKIHLLPFGEYVPLVETFPWIKRLAPYEDNHVPNLVSGGSPTWFDEGPIRYAPVICFEDSVPYLVRRFFTETKDGRPPDVIVNISNDGWFNGSAEHEMHLATSVFRCVEHRAPMVRASNMGLSAIVDGNGQVLTVQATKTEGAVTAPVPLDPRQTVYTLVGDIFPQACLTVSIACFAITVMSSPNSRIRKNPRSTPSSRLA